MGSKGSAPRAKSRQGRGGGQGQGRPDQAQANQARSAQPEEALDITHGRSGMWGALAGLIVAALIAVPLSAAFAFATHPTSQQLFGGRLEGASPGGYVAFWWIVTLLLAGLPFLVGFGVARLSVRSLTIVGAIIVLFLIAILVLGQLFVF
jgi:amino acid transporter